MLSLLTLKTFDLINHDSLHIMLSLRIVTVHQSRLLSFAFREQEMSNCNGEYSTEGIVRHGVLQRSVLIPCLFCFCCSRVLGFFNIFFYIKALPLNITGNMINCDMFADGTTLNTFHASTVSIEKELQTSINEVSDWCNKNAMVLRPYQNKQHATC